MKKICLLLLLPFVILLSACGEERVESRFSHDELNHTQELTMKIAQESLNPNGLTLIITNQTETELSFDMLYILEYKENGQWYAANMDQAFNALAAILPAGHSVEFSVIFEEELEKGFYRIIKPVNTSKGNAYLSEEFYLE